jgi:myo-inositol-1(or 4)-monophosphatase
VLDVATRAAHEAAALVLAGWRTGTRAEHKGRVDLVTKFDRASEDLLRARLTGETPFAFVGEEQGGERARGEGSPTWYVDPLDGTTNFVHGHFFYCVSVGLLIGQTPSIGVVVAPSLGVTWTGIATDGAWRNGEPCRVSAVDALPDALVATGGPPERQARRDERAHSRRADRGARCPPVVASSARDPAALSEVARSRRHSSTPLESAPTLPRARTAIPRRYASILASLRGS